MKRYCLLALLSLLLVACHQSVMNYDYLMTHPDDLMAEKARCEKANVNCDDVNRAATDFDILVQSAKFDPQEFGKKIIAAQMDAAVVLAQLQQLEKNPAENSAQIDALKKTYREDLQKIKIFMSVTAITDWG